MSQETTEVDEYLTFKILTPKGLILTIPAEQMPKGWQVWTVGPKDIACAASERLGLPVTVELKQVCTSRRKE